MPQKQTAPPPRVNAARGRGIGSIGNDRSPSSLRHRYRILNAPRPVPLLERIPPAWERLDAILTRAVATWGWQ